MRPLNLATRTTLKINPHTRKNDNQGCAGVCKNSSMGWRRVPVRPGRARAARRLDACGGADLRKRTARNTRGVRQCFTCRNETRVTQSGGAHAAAAVGVEHHTPDEARIASFHNA